VLALSADPAHSLGDAFASRLTAAPLRLRTRRGSLLAAEVDARSALDRWLGERRDTLREIAERGTYLDPDDVDRLLGLSLPGADELAALLELSRLARETACDEGVVDTAPTGHALRLLRTPGLVRRFAGVLDVLEERHRLMAERFAGVHRPDRADAMIVEMDAQGRELADLLHDPERGGFVWVLLPEALSIAETRDGLAALDEAGVAVREVVVNRVTPPRPGLCPSCRERRRSELEAIAEIRESFGGRGLRFLPAFEREPRGLPALRRVAAALTDPGRGEELLAEPRSPRARSRRAHRSSGPPEWLPILAPKGLRLLLLGGKGGVGKTTCAAAVALAIAAARPDQRILLLSTDPAHSLADVLGLPLGDDERPVPGAPPGLRVRELDAAGAYERWRARHRADLGEAIGSFAGEGGDEAVRQVLALEPPGLDELVALSALLDAALEEGGANLVVVDTAPTGHALRLLESPELALEWDRALLSLLLKYREALGLGGFAAELVDLSRSLKRLLALLRDPDRTRFAAVTRAAELPRRETVRLLGELRRLGIAVPAVVVNAAAVCGCPGEADAPGPSLEMERLRRLVPDGCAIITAPAEHPPPRGVEALTEWARTWEAPPG
jgi:arsenite-transporting ATPase